MKLLGIDYGTKRIGLAVSDDGMKFAFPKKVLLNNASLFEEIAQVIKVEKIFEIVVGDSVDFNGTPNEISQEVANFVEELGSRFQIPVRMEKEFLTSFEAHGRLGKEGLHARQSKVSFSRDVDASAAALILQRFLDKRNKSLENI